MSIATIVLISVLVLLALIFILQTIYIMVTLETLEKRILPVVPHVPPPPRNLASFIVLTLRDSRLPSNTITSLVDIAFRNGAIRSAEKPLPSNVKAVYADASDASTTLLINGIQDARILFVVLQNNLYAVHYHDALEKFMRESALGVHRMPDNQRLVLLRCLTESPTLPLGINLACNASLSSGRYLALAFGLP